MDKKELLKRIRDSFKPQWYGTDSVWLLKVHDPEGTHRPGISETQGIYLSHHRTSGEIHLWVTTARLLESPYSDSSHIRVWCLKTDRTGWYEHPFFERDFDEWWELNRGSLIYLMSLKEIK